MIAKHAPAHYRILALSHPPCSLGNWSYPSSICSRSLVTCHVLDLKFRWIIWMAGCSRGCQEHMMMSQHDVTKDVAVFNTPAVLALTLLQLCTRFACSYFGLRSPVAADSSVHQYGRCKPRAADLDFDGKLVQRNSDSCCMRLPELLCQQARGAISPLLLEL